MISRLTLSNFQKHTNAVFEFKPGLNLITGPNWVGKSTLLRGLLYALGGSKLVKIRAEYLTTLGETSMEVSLELSTGETIARGSKRAVVYAPDGRSLASGHGAVNGWVEDYFGLSLTDFRAFRVAEQGEPDALLTAGSAALTDHLSRVTGAKLIDTALSWLSREQAEARGVVTGMTATKNDLLEIEAQAKRLTQSISDLQEQLHPLRLKRAEMEHGQDEWAKYLKQVDGQLKQYREYSLRCRFLDGELSKIVHQLSELSEVSPPFGDIIDMETRLTQAQQRVTHYQQTQALIAQHQQQVVQAEARIDQIQAELDGLEVPSSVDSEQRDHLYQMLGQLGSEIQNRRAALEQAVCPTCQRPYEVAVPVEVQQTELEGCEERYRVVQEQLAQILARERRVQELTQRREALRIEIQSLQAQADLSRQQLSRMATVAIDLEQETEQVQQLQALVTQFHAQKRAHEHYTLQKNGLEATYARLVDDQKALSPVEPIDEAAIAQAEQAIAQFTAHLRDLDIRIAKTEAKLNQELTIRDKVDERLIQMRERLKVYDHSVRRVETTDALTKFLRKNREQFLQQLWNNLLGYTNSFIAEASGGEMTEFRRDDGGFKYVENGSELPVECASGMQTAILGVALKLALGAALGVKTPLLLLDEVTAAGSPENSAVFVSLLREQAGQVLLVTHREADAALADWVVRVEG